VELFHKCVKQNLGFEDVATHGFDAVMSHSTGCIVLTSCFTWSPPASRREPEHR